MGPELETPGSLRVDNRGVLLLAVPAILEMALHMAVWAVDTAMVGRLGAIELSAVGLGGQVYFALAFILASTCVATGALVARASGAGDSRGAASAGGQGMLLAVGLGLAMAVATWIGAPHLFRLVDLGPEVARQGVAYLRSAAPAASFFLPLLMANAIIRARGDTRTPLVITLVANGINIVGDWALIFGRLGFEPRGVVGAAEALLLGQMAGMLLAVFALARVLPWRTGDFLRPAAANLRRMLRIALPAGLETLLIDGSRVLTLFIIASLGPVAVAATQVGIAAEALSFMPGYGLAIAAGIMAGQAAGAGRPDLVRRSTGLSRKWALAFMSLLGLAFIIWPASFIRIFTTDPEVIRLGAMCLRVAGIAQPLIAITEVVMGSMRGMGDTRRAVVFTALGSWGLRVPLTLLVIHVLGLGLVAAWWAMVVDWALRAVLATHYFRSGLWERLQV